MANAELTAGKDSVPVKLFRGYDTVSRGILTSSAVEGAWENTGVSSAVRVQVCESLAELADALDIDASLNVSYLKAVDVTAKMEFARKLNVTAKSVSIVVYARHGLGTWDAKDVTLKTGAGAPTAPTDAESATAFVKTYGDSFIRSVTLGGEFFAVYIFNTETREEQQSLAASLKTDVVSGVTVKAEAQVKLNNFLKTTKTNWTLKQDMTGIRNPDFPDQDKLIPFALGFSKLPLDGPVVTNIKVTGYEEVNGFGRGFDKIVKSRDFFLDRRNGLLPRHGLLKGIENQIQRLKAIYARYKFADPELEAFKERVDADIAAIEDQVDAWRDNPTGNFTRPPLPSLKEGEPVLDFVAHPVASFGQEGGGTFDFMSVGNAFRNQVRIVSIRLSDGTWDGFQVIRRIEIEYASEKGRWTAVHGENGNGREKFFLEDGQFISFMRIRFGRMVDALEIHTEDGRSTRAGGGGGTSSDWTPQPGVTILGFAGRAGAALDQIKIINGSLKKAKFVKT
jgi:Jacalin-like lectin domain/MAC/Perforin domain